VRAVLVCFHRKRAIGPFLPRDRPDEQLPEYPFAAEKVVRERLRFAVRTALISVLEEEVTAFVGAKPDERNEERRDQRNGHYSRNLETTAGLIPDLPVPRTRQGHQTQLFERYHRRREELDSAIGDMFVKGVSQAKVGQVIETLTGSQPSASTVSRVFHTLETEYEQWKQRPLDVLIGSQKEHIAIFVVPRLCPQKQIYGPTTCHPPGSRCEGKEPRHLMRVIRLPGSEPLWIVCHRLSFLLL
jgi:hypothetical protein